VQKELARSKPEQKQKGEASQKLTQQHIANRLDNTNKKRVAFLKMGDPRYQTGYFIFKDGYLFYQSMRSTGFVKSNLSLAFHQRQATFKV
jgi:hypothetical protein